MQKIRMPILFCRADGEIIYKNDAARHWIRTPRVGAKLMRFVQGEPAQNVLPTLNAILDGSLPPRVIRIYTETCYRRALAAPFDTGEERVVALLFPPLLQIGDLNPSYEAVERSLLPNWEGILAHLREHPEISGQPTQAGETPSYRRIRGVDERMTEYFNKLISVNGSEFPEYEIAYCIRMIQRVAQHVLAELGYRVSFDFDDLRFVPHADVLFLPLAIPYFSLATAALEISPDKAASFRLRMDDLDLCLDVEIKADESFRSGPVACDQLTERYPSLAPQILGGWQFEGQDGWHIGCRCDTFGTPKLIFTLHRRMPDNIAAIGILKQDPPIVARLRSEELFELAMAVMSSLLDGVEPKDGSRLPDGWN